MAAGYAWAALAILIATLVALPIRALIEPSNVALLFVLAVVFTAVRHGRGAAVFAALAGSATFAYVFLPPHFSLLITEARYLLSALVMLLVALMVGHLTSRLKHQTEMARATEIRHAAETLRTSILSALSHDLRTPLTALVGMADTLALGKASPERQKHLLEAIRNQAMSINQQMGKLLDMARLRSGTIELDMAWQPVEEVIGATLRLVRAQWKDREVSVDIEPGLPPLRLDAVLMERVLWNLLENAIKYSPPEAPVELIVRAAGDCIEIGVHDSGCGLPPGSDESLFGMFRRGHAESDIPGVGLGLAIARTIVEAHGGSISAANRTGGGASFRVHLPIGAPPSFSELEEHR